jgi:hypothetical protein
MATIDLRTEAIQILSALSEESLPVAVGLLTALKNHKPLEKNALLSIYPWARHLSDAERDEFFAEWSDATKQATSCGDASIVDEVIEAWQETAEILADSEMMADIRDAEKQIEKGEVASWDAVKQRLHIK